MHRHHVRRAVGWVLQACVWAFVIGVVVVLAAAVVIPRLAGATPFTVLTGSMRPDYPPGTLVVVKPVAFEDIGVGDVITYQLESGKATVVTHRVTAIAAQLDGEVVLTTQGDANNVSDPEAVEEVQVRGRLWYSVPYLGHVNNALTGSQRQTAVLVVSATLVGYAVFMFVGALRDRRRKKSPDLGGDVEEQEVDIQDEQQDEQQDDPRTHPEVENEHVGRGRISGSRVIGLLAGLVAAGLAYRLIRARNGRSIH